MKKGKIISLIILLYLFTGCSNINDVQCLKKIFTVLSKDQVYLEGSWKLITTPTKSRKIPKINSTKILCNRQLMVCTEWSAHLESNVLVYPYLYPDETEYRIIEWSETKIKAESEARAVDVELVISIPEKSAEKTMRETTARGAIGAEPEKVQHWILE